MTVSFGSVMFRAFDLEKFICKLDKDLKSKNSFRRLGMVMIGSVRKSRILFA